MLSTKLTAIAFAITALSASLSAERLDLKVRNDFFAGFSGDGAAMDRAMILAEKEIADHPDTAAEALAWHGSALLFRSGVKFQHGDMPGGMQMWTKAMEEMEKAGAMEPDNVAVLIPRAAAWFAASRGTPPEMSKPILAKAIADYEKVFDMQKAYFDTLGTHPQSELLFGLADGYARSGNAVKARFYFEKLSRMQPASGHQEQANQFLAGEKYTVTGTGCIGCHVAK